MQMPNLISCRSSILTYLFTLTLGLSAQAIDVQCVNGHELCPQHLIPTQFSVTYHEMIANQTKPTAFIEPKAQPVVIVKTEPTIIPNPPVKTVDSDTDHDGVIDDIDQCPNTPKGYKVDTKGCPSSVTMHINFTTGSSSIPLSSYTDVDLLTAFLQENPAASITIIGHTDNIGKEAENISLSKMRAEALAVRIIENGISNTRILTEGKGFSQPLASNNTKKGRAQNRRIDVQIR